MPMYDPDLITVLEATDSFALTLAKSSLEDAGIEYVVSGDNPRYFAGRWLFTVVNKSRCPVLIIIDLSAL
jgi:hypothetical protein